MNRNKLAIVIGFDPFHQKNGDSIRFFSWLDFLKSSEYDFELYISMPHSSRSNRMGIPDDYPDGITIHLFERDHFRFPTLGTLKRHFRAITIGAPPWIVASYSTSLNEQIKQLPPSTPIILLGEAAGLYLNLGRSSFTLWDKSNVLTASTVSELGESKGFYSKIRYLYHSILAKRFELPLLNSQCWITATSEHEISRISQLTGNKNVRLLPSANGPYKNIYLDNNSKRFGWIGSFTYAPNWRGLIRFLTIADQILCDFDYRLKVMGVGANSGQLKKLAKFKAVDFVGYVDEIEEGISDCRFLVVPLWSGAGIKIKSLDALKYGVPLITTPFGGEGIQSNAIYQLFEEPDEMYQILLEIETIDIQAHLEECKQVYLQNHSQNAFEERLRSILGDFLSTSL